MDWTPKMVEVRTRYSELEIAAIASHLDNPSGKNLEALTARLQGAAQYYIRILANLGAPPPSKVEERLVAIQNAARKFYETIERHNLPALWPRLGEGFFNQAHDLRVRSEYAVKAFDYWARPGRSRKNARAKALIAFIEELNAIYNDEMGYSGLSEKKRKYLVACLSPFEIDLTRDQLRQRYRQALGDLA